MVWTVVSLNRGPQYRPQNTIVLIMGTPKMVPLILGNPQVVQGLKASRQSLSLKQQKASSQTQPEPCTRLVSMGGCQNYPFLGNLNIRCRIIIGIQRGTIIWTTTQIGAKKRNQDRSAIRVRENPKPAEVEARVERQRGWDHTVRGARLGAFSTSTPKPQILKPKTLNLKP